MDMLRQVKVREAIPTGAGRSTGVGLHTRVQSDRSTVPIPEVLTEADPCLTTAVASPHRLMPLAVPAIVPLVPANKANQSGHHERSLSLEK